MLLEHVIKQLSLGWTKDRDMNRTETGKQIQPYVRPHFVDKKCNKWINKVRVNSIVLIITVGD